jgi:hypothetical protein
LRQRHGGRCQERDGGCQRKKSIHFDPRKIKSLLVERRSLNKGSVQIPTSFERPLTIPLAFAVGVFRRENPGKYRMAPSVPQAAPTEDQRVLRTRATASRQPA